MASLHPLQTHEIGPQPPSLLSSLPPELRHSVYAYLSYPTPTSLAHIISLPLPLKTYTCKHTTIEICPSHHSSAPSLLSPHAFAESREYITYLLANATTLHINITFHGRVGTFVQEHWDKRMEGHWRKLVKRYGWLGKVVWFDVRVLWAPGDGVVRCKNGKRSAGGIVGGLVGGVTGLVDSGVRGRKGDVSVGVCVARHVAVQGMVSGVRFGLVDLLGRGGAWGFKTWDVEVRMEVCGKKTERRGKGAVLVPVSRVRREEEEWRLVVEDGVVKWRGWGETCLVMRECVEGGNRQRRFGEESGDFVVKALVGECVEGR